MAALDRLLHRIGDPLDESKPHPLVTLEEFFTDNHDPESLGDYAQSKFDPQSFFAALVDLRDRDGFHDIRVEILPKLSPAGRPCSDTVWIVSDFDRMELPRQLTPTFWDGFLQCDWLSYPCADGVSIEPVDAPDDVFVQGFAYYYYD
ncbi:MAG: hypothetical protein ACE361_20490 [Aureliella sp.]